MGNAWFVDEKRLANAQYKNARVCDSFMEALDYAVELAKRFENIKIRVVDRDNDKVVVNIEKGTLKTH